MSLRVITADWIKGSGLLEDQSVHCCVTSPPYWGLRDYGVKGQLGLEKTPQEYVEKLVKGFREVKRVLRDDGTLWLNLGDCYATGAGSGRSMGGDCFGKSNKVIDEGSFPVCQPNRMALPGLKPKDLIGVPWRVAFALQADGWYLRSDIIWHKPNPMPESVTDRPTKAHEYIFLLSKSAKYYYDAEAIKEKASDSTHARLSQANLMKQKGGDKDYRNGTNPNRSMRKTLENYARKSAAPGSGIKNNTSFDQAMAVMPADRNKRSVWTVATAPYSEAHFATFPPDLIKPCILAGCPLGGTVLDPFGGSGTTGQVAIELGRSAVLIELNPEYVKLIGHRTNVTPGLPL